MVRERDGRSEKGLDGQRKGFLINDGCQSDVTPFLAKEKNGSECGNKWLGKPPKPLIAASQTSLFGKVRGDKWLHRRPNEAQALKATYRGVTNSHMVKCAAKKDLIQRRSWLALLIDST